MKGNILNVINIFSIIGGMAKEARAKGRANPGEGILDTGRKKEGPFARGEKR